MPPPTKSIRKRNWLVWAFCAIFLLLSLTLFLAASTPFDSARSYVDQYSGDGSADPYTPVLHVRLQLLSFAAAMGFLLMGLITATPIKLFQRFSALDTCALQVNQLVASLRCNVLQLGQLVFQSIRANTCLLFFVIATYSAVHLVTPSPAIRFDEAISWRDYSKQPFWVTASKYDTPNNHIFYNLITGQIITLFGSSLPALRMAAFCSGLGVVCFTMLIMCEWLGKTTGFCCALMILLAPGYYEYSIYARGYSLQTFLWLCSALFLWNALRCRNLSSLFVASFFAALGFWTVPTMMYPFAATFIAGLVSVFAVPFLRGSKFDGFRNLFIWGLLTTVFTLVLYGPVLIVSGYQSITSNPFVKSLTFASWLQGIAPTTNDTVALLYGDLSLIRMSLLLIGLFAAVMGLSINIKSRPILIISIAGLLSLAVILSVQRVLPPPRTWVWLTIPISMLLTVAWSQLWRQLLMGEHRESIQQIPNASLKETRDSPRTRIAYSVAMVCTTLVFSGMGFIDIANGSRLSRSQEGGRCNGSRKAVDFLKEHIRVREPIIAICPSSGTLDFYANRAGLSSHHFNTPEMVWNKSDHSISPNSVESPNDLTSPSNQKDSRRAIVAVVNNEGFKQTVDSVLEAYPNAKELALWERELIFEADDVELYRIYESAVSTDAIAR